jgi:hypothetical protein
MSKLIEKLLFSDELEEIQMKKLMLISALGLFSLIALTAAFGTIDQPDKITISNPKGDVVFPHKEHVDNGITCKTCHHNVAGDMDAPENTCRDCHTADSDVTAKDAFHTRCRDCHKQKKMENPETKAPTSCKGCHQS